ncbi:MAG: formylmethanofuran dehydrogenase subunit E family protein [Theionarchaea archaeon]|nr:MAG: hypothetical protein AYK18_03120 [Theionarchaea archaeon DG-70]MBU7012191.1 formylmethanofuran dehydrogenase subunit E family protein [Theionarchaea archaeon]
MNLPDSFIQQAKAFHGHLGPYLVLGLRMGLLAKNTLNGDPFTLKAEIHTQKTPPWSCILDGIQFSSGCTLGKGNIQVQEDNDIYGIFYKDSQTVKIEIKKEILDSIPHIPREELESYALQLATQKDKDLFDVIS